MKLLVDGVTFVIFVRESSRDSGLAPTCSRNCDKDTETFSSSMDEDHEDE